MTVTQPSTTSNFSSQVADSPCQTFLRSVAENSGLDTTYDARDISEVVFRTVRDLMPTEVSNRIAKEFENIESEFGSEDITLSQLWLDTNPLVRWLSQMRSPLDIRDEIFLRRISQEAGVPKNVDIYEVLLAVFSATKQVLSLESSAEISEYLPGKIRFAWNRA